MKKIGIIGGGLSGSLLLFHALKKTKTPTHFILFEKDFEKLFKGVAYSSLLPYQLLNVPIKGMSLFDEQPQHFLNWLLKNNLIYNENDFVPRTHFGKYLHEELEKAINDHSEHKVTLIKSIVIGIELNTEEKYTIKSPRISIDDLEKVFICTGNFAPSDISSSTEVQINFRYVKDPWSGHYLTNIHNEDTIAIVGTGLTMVDQVLSIFNNSNFKGKVIAFSRRGLLPNTHTSIQSYQFSTLPDFSKTNLNFIVKWFRNEIKIAEQQGINWQSVVDALRPYNQLIWISLSHDDRLRFSRHLRPYWDIHRHRIPVESAKAIQDLISTKRLTVIAGRIKEILPLSMNNFQIHFNKNKGADFDSVFCNWIINCSGPQADLRKIDSQLIKNLIENKLAQFDDLQLGIKTDRNGHLLDAENKSQKNLIAIGPPAKGTLWECIALREIRKQVEEISKSFG